MFGLGLTLFQRAFRGGMSYVYDNLILFFNFKKHQDTPITHASTGSTSFDGSDDHIQISDHSTIQNVFASGGTISTWVYANSDGENSVGRIADKANWFLCLTGESGGISDIRFLSVTSGDDGDWITTNTCVPNGVWTHIALVYDGSSTSNNPTIYVNGSSQALTESTTPASTQTSDASNDLYIGNRADGIACFDGSLANVGIWSRALSSSEVQGIMYKKYADLSTADQVSLVSFWGLDEAVENDYLIVDKVNPSYSFGSELVSNGSFDSATTGWSVTAGTIAIVSGGQDGNCLELTRVSGSSYISQGLGAVAVVGKIYKFSFYVKSGTSDVPYIGRIWDGSNYKLDLNGTSSGEWVEVVGVWKADTTTITIEMYRNSSTSGTMLFDSVSIKEVTSDGNLAHISGATNNSTVYGDNAPSKPRIFDSAPDVVDNYGTLKSGTAVSFDGSNDYVDIFNSEQVPSNFQSLSDALTISMWFKADAVSGNDTGSWISYYTLAEMRTETASATHIPFNVGINNSKLCLGVTDNHTTSDERIDGNTTLLVDTWYHCAITINGDAYVIYINGSSDKSGTLSTATGDRSVGTTTSNFFIGARSDNSGGGGSFFDGSISNVQVWDSVLTLSEIQEMYLNPEQILPTGVSSSNLKLHLPLNEGVGTQNYDGSGNQNHGTMNGATWSKANTDIAQVGLVRQNTSMVFDGSNDTVNMGNVLNVGTSDFSVAFWINKTDTGNVQRVYSNYGAPGFTIRKDASEKINIYMREGGGGNSTITTSTALDSNKFYHIVCTFDRSSDCKIYINASLDVTTSISVMDGDTMNNSVDLVIGGGNSQEFDGIMNEVAQWDVVLDADAITALYNSGTPLDASVDSGNYDNSDDLQGYWRNDGITTWTDRSTNSNNGTVAGTPDSIVLTEGLTSGRDSQGFFLTDTTENCLTLNGAEYVDLDGSVNTFATDSIGSIEAWFKTSVTGTYKEIVTASDKSDASSDLTIGLGSTNKIEFSIREGGTLLSLSSNATTYADGNWHHVVIVVGESSNKLYIDRTQDSSVSYATGSASTQAWFNDINDIDTLRVGVREDSGGNEYPFNGMIDDVRIYDKALSASDVEKNYNAGKSKHS